MMTLLTKIGTVFGLICIMIAGAFSLLFIGKRKGAEEERSKQNEEVLDAVEETKRAIDRRSGDSIDVVRARVRSHNRD